MMKYKVGDKVKIKEDNYYQPLIPILRKTNWIVTIKRIGEYYYRLEEEADHRWEDSHIEKLVSKAKREITRFDLMDFE